jgi:hypothetical protein
MDFSYLSGQTFGDHRLEAELLGRFLAQGRSLIPRLLDRGAQDDAAHLLRGSSLAVGATQVTAAVEAYEQAPAHERVADGPLYKELVMSFERTEAAIETRLALLRNQSGDIPS